MGIYIKSMNVPKSCEECLGVGWHYVFECNIDDVEEGEKLSTCPLFFVPPHGRLIDADKLRDNNCDVFEINEADGTILAMDVSIIDDTPTIIEAEEGESKDANNCMQRL